MARWRIFVPRSHDQMLFSHWRTFAKGDALLLWKLTGQAERAGHLTQTSPKSPTLLRGRGEEGESASLFASYITAHIFEQFANLC